MDIGAAKRVARLPSENICVAEMVKLCTVRSRVIRADEASDPFCATVPLFRGFRCHKMKRNRSQNTTNSLLAKTESSYATTCFDLFCGHCQVAIQCH